MDQRQTHQELYNYLNELKATDIRYLAEAMDDNVDYSQQKINDTINFIFENLLIAINCHTFGDNNIDSDHDASSKGDKVVIDWCFTEILKARTKKIKPGMKWWNYYPCLIHAMSYICKDLRLLDNIDRFLRISSSDYVDTYHLSEIADHFNIAFKVKIGRAHV